MAKTELLSIFNESFSKGVVPGIWKEATILPLKKAGKPPGAISSYRPVSLISCIVKTMEWMVHNRLYNLAETRRWLCSEQAGFRKLRSCEDQILRITQTISDGFQAAKPQRSLMALLDFSIVFGGKNSCLQHHPRASRFPSPAGCATFYQTAQPGSR